MEYGSLTVPDLKKLLRERGASLRGKKKDLVERLIQYDTNNITINHTPDTRQDESHCLFMPAITMLKDINADTNLPPLTMLNIGHYLERFDTSLEKGKTLYENEFLVFIRMATTDNRHYFIAQCKASMKKHVTYNVGMHISLHGGIEGCQCDCCVGEAPTAHCKHVVAVLLAIEQLKRKKTIILHKACTQKLNSFQKQQSFFGSPIKGQNLVPQERNMNFNPLKNVNSNKYNEMVRNMCVNFIGHSQSTMPFKYTIPPANIYAFINDHNYIDHKMPLLKQLYLTHLSQNNIKEIEIATRNQDKSDFWHELRKTHLTASNFYGICTSVSNDAKINLAKRIINPNPFKSRQTQHGKDCEAKAIALYESYGVTVQKCGLFLMPEMPFIGASPDGLIGEETVLEIKCPYNQKDMYIDETIPYLKKNDNGELYLDPINAYYYQIQGQLMVTGRKYANLLVYTNVDWKVIDVPKDEGFIYILQQELESFYLNYFQPEILKTYLLKGM